MCFYFCQRHLRISVRFNSKVTCFSLRLIHDGGAATSSCSYRFMLLGGCRQDTMPNTSIKQPIIIWMTYRVALKTVVRRLRPLYRLCWLYGALWMTIYIYNYLMRVQTRLSITGVTGVIVHVIDHVINVRLTEYTVDTLLLRPFYRTLLSVQ